MQDNPTTSASEALQSKYRSKRVTRGGEEEPEMSGEMESYDVGSTRALFLIGILRTVLPVTSQPAT